MLNVILDKITRFLQDNQMNAVNKTVSCLSKLRKITKTLSMPFRREIFFYPYTFKTLRKSQWNWSDYSLSLCLRTNLTFFCGLKPNCCVRRKHLSHLDQLFCRDPSVCWLVDSGPHLCRNIESSDLGWNYYTFFMRGTSEHLDRISVTSSGSVAIYPIFV